ncbi:MAG: cbb3-type cytochrome c oxidase subunit I [Caldilineales bacterium]|nr:cbb3-type cytochrome c oxidase subunit I [Caldilineales bacterium]
MPRLSCWFVRAALLYLAVGFSLGALLLTTKGLGWSPLWWRWLPAHIEFLVIGWTGQLILGVAFWILPRFGGSRGREGPAWLAFGLINLGVLLAGLGPVLAAPGWVVLAGRLAELAAMAAFAAHAWPRIKPIGVL